MFRPLRSDTGDGCRGRNLGGSLGRFGQVLCLTTLVLGAVVMAPAGAHAYQEPNALAGTGCSYCHPAVWVDPPGYLDMQRRPTAGGDCPACHADYVQDEWIGPHGNYSTMSSKCAVCHTVHSAPAGGIMLLPQATISDTCLSCHDGTGGNGVYGTVLARTGVAPGGGHRYEVTNEVPGGDGATGGTTYPAFAGVGGTLTCTDCHSPHGADVVQAFKGDRRRVRGSNPAPVTSRLLRRQPGGSTTPVDEYGSDWCLGCHDGRASGGFVHNHPVDSASTHATPFTYSNVAILASEDLTGLTVLGSLGGVPFVTEGHWADELDNSGNRGYLMPVPRTAEQADHAPICQQCHEDTRDVGVLSADGSQGDAAVATISAADGVIWDGSAWVDSLSDNPRFQNFPHETENYRLLVEQYDNLCTNCHAPDALP